MNAMLERFALYGNRRQVRCAFLGDQPPPCLFCEVFALFDKQQSVPRGHQVVRAQSAHCGHGVLCRLVHTIILFRLWLKSGGKEVFSFL
jgi:hypothetical protein